MIKNLIGLILAVVIVASVAYQMNWLSSDGEDVYDDVENAVKEALDK